MGGGNMGGGGGGGNFGGPMGNGMGPGMGNGGMQLDQANLNNLMGTLLSNLERNIIQRQTMGGGGYRDRVPTHRMTDRDRRDRGPLRGVSKTDRGGIRRDRFQPKFSSTRDRDTYKKTSSSRDAKPRTDKERRSTDSKKKESVKKDEEKKEKKDEEKKEDGAEAKKDDAEKSESKTDGETSKTKSSTEAYCTVCEKFFTGDLVDHRRSSTHKEEKQKKFPTGQRRCDVCKISFFKTQQQLWNHLRSSLHRKNTTRAVNVKREDKTNGDLVTVDTVGYSDDEDGTKKARGSSKRSATENDDKDAKKSKLEHSKEVLDALAAIPKDDPNPVVAMDHVVPMTGYYCKVCHKFYHNEVMAKVTHCRSKPHSAKYEEGIKNGTIKAPVSAEDKAEKAEETAEETAKEGVDEKKNEEKAEEEKEKTGDAEEKMEQTEAKESEEKDQPAEETAEEKPEEEERQAETADPAETEEKADAPEAESQGEAEDAVKEVATVDAVAVAEEPSKEEASKEEEDVLLIGGEESGDVESSNENGAEDTAESQEEGDGEEEKKPAAAKKNVAKRGGKATRGRKKAAS